MSDKIMKAVSPGFANRMRWWAQFRADGGTPIATTFSRRGVSSGSPSSLPPLFLGIVHDTAMAIDALPRSQALAVKLFWLFEGRSLRWMARRLSEEMPLRYRRLDYHTVESWVLKGHVELR